MIAARGMERALLLGAGIAIGVGVSAIVQRLIARRSALRSARPLRMRSAVPPRQLCPSCVFQQKIRSRRRSHLREGGVHRTISKGVPTWHASATLE